MAAARGISHHQLQDSVAHTPPLHVAPLHESPLQVLALQVLASQELLEIRSRLDHFLGMLADEIA